MGSNNIKDILLLTMYEEHAEIYSYLLEEEGYAVTNVHTAKNAVRTLERGEIDLLIMGSRQLPNVRLVEQLYETKGTELPRVIIHTSFSNPEQVYRGSPLEEHIGDYVVKSVNPDGFIQAVKRALPKE